MSSGLAQLLAIGSQDVHLTGEPQVSFFRSNYKTHTNFSQVIHNQVISGNIRNNGMSSVRFEKLGDLLSYTYMVAENNGVVVSLGSESNPWSDYIDKIEILIGGQVIDTHTTEFSQELATDVLAQTYSKSVGACINGGFGTDTDFYPLRFFFCENWQSCIPLLSLTFHDTELRIYWGPLAETYNMKVYSNFIYIDRDERNYFTKNKIDLLIYQVQKNVPSNTKVHELNFTSPVKFITSSNAVSNQQNTLASYTNKIKLEINGIDISEPKTSAPHFTSVSSYYSTPFASGNITNQFIYPFCLDTAKLQPTGTLNFSRISNAKIISEYPITRNIYAVNYNILRIQNGLGGVLYMS